MQSNFSKGFTLIELLVTTAIISILATIGLVSYGETMKSARDGKRRTDLREIQNAYEQYYSVCGNLYPTITVSNPTTAPGISVNPVICNSPSSNLLPTFPSDPKDKYFYYCQTNCAGSSYKICGRLESDGSEICVENKQ
jgi:prepilin-type N-terminal cleavage/methylation domain-containing protein